MINQSHICKNKYFIESNEKKPIIYS